MKSTKKTGKRGRPKKIQPKVEEIITKPLVLKKEDVIDVEPISVDTPIKRGRGRPPKSVIVNGEENITIKPHIEEPIIEEEYIQPKVMRKKRVFRFDKRVFHQFAKKYDGDIVIMSYVYDRLMRMYVDKKLKIPTIDEVYYGAWCNGGTPPIEPIVEREISSSHALLKGVPLQYKYPLLIDEEMFARYEKSCDRYPQYISNELVKRLLDDNINISTSKYKEWCIL